MQLVSQNSLADARPIGDSSDPAVRAAFARPARLRRRHLGVVLSFLVLVLLPVDAASYYLYFVAKDRFASRVGFSVQREDAAGAIELLGGAAGLTGSSSTDTDILAEFISSQELVARVDARLDLARVFTAREDPVFSLRENPTIEDLLKHWRRMVTVYYEPSSGLIEVRAQAFSASDATAVARAVFDESTAMINTMNAAARDDATRYARADLTRALTRLKQARRAITAFRARTQIVDPGADVAARMALLADLEQQRTESRIDLGLLQDTTRPNDPRIAQAERRLAVLSSRIEEERAGFGPDGEERDYSALIDEYEGLRVDLEFAEQAYLAARTEHEAAQARAQRQSRYLAAYLGPTQAERAEYPRRATLLALIAGFLLVGWSVLTLAGYSLRDRR